eukprot:7132112-Prymnesium_polylepis.1
MDIGHLLCAATGFVAPRTALRVPSVEHRSAVLASEGVAVGVDERHVQWTLMTHNFGARWEGQTR